nr:PREDICTED: ankyrin repeat domain-containing protein 65-like isoform X2 [Daucus carota subsp. sativus]
MIDKVCSDGSGASHAAHSSSNTFLIITTKNMEEEEAEKLVEVSEQEICIDFSLGCKCRATVHLRSLSSTASTAFKIQTSSPHKFLVNPPSGLIAPLSHTTFQVILKPQSQLPSPFPRCSPCDKFLVRTALAPPQLGDVNSWFNSLPDSFVTRDVRLKVSFVGPFLLRHAVITGDYESARNVLRRQKTGLASREAESLVRVAAELENSEAMVELLTESTTHNISLINDRELSWTELHVAAANNRTDEISSLISKKEGGPLDCKDAEGRTALYLAAKEGFEGCVTVLARAGANVDARTHDGRTALYKAFTNGDRRMMELLLQMGADPTSDHRGRSPLQLKEVVELLERGEAVLNASRSGHVKLVEQLLETDAKINYCDQYGLSPLHAAAIKGHKDVAMLLVEYGSELINSRDADGHTPLHLAVQSGDQAMVEVLLNRGAEVNALTNKGATPLYISQLLRCDDITRLLLASGADSTLLPLSCSSDSWAFTTYAS